MMKPMKVMLAYDGSSFADHAIEDLPRAGLPTGSEVLVVSVADLSASSPEVSEFALLSSATGRIEAVLAREGQVFRETADMASEATHRLRSRFPDWDFRYEILQGKPADELLQKAAQWKPDLIVSGSQGRSAIGRFFLGSVSKRIAEQASCSVRVARRGFEKTQGEPVKIIVGAQSLADADRVIEAVGRRDWESTAPEMRLVAIDDGVSAGRISAVYPDAKAIFEQTAQRLAATGLQISVQVESGDPKTILLEAADAWRADAIFVVAESAKYKPGLNETAASLITGAKCTVEIVR